MRGKILSAPSGEAAGVISGDDGRRYRYAMNDLRGVTAQAGRQVDFEATADMARDVYGVPGSGQAITIPDRDWVSFYLSPNGRISRRDYWLYGFLVIFVASLVLGWIPVIGQILSLGLAWAGIAVAFKRLHDLDYPGWWCFVPSVPLVVGSVLLMIGAAMSHGGFVFYTLAALCILGGFATSLWLIFGVLIKQGQTGANRYGPDPLVAGA